jgi:hypothetical protein
MSETETIESPVEASNPADDLEGMDYPVIGGEPLNDDNDTDEDDAPVAVEQSSDEEEAVSADEIPSIDPALLTQAQRYGLDPADFGGSSAALSKALVALDRKSLEFIRQPPPAPQQRQEQPPAAPSKFEKLDLKAILGNVDEYDPALVKAFEGINDHYATHVEKLHTQLEQASSALSKVEQHEQFLQQQSLKQHAQAMDGFFNSLGDKGVDLFGKGSITEVDPELARNRKAVDDQTYALYLADLQMGRQTGTEDEYRQRALYAVFGPELEKRTETTVRNSIKAKVKKAQSAPLATPSKKTGAPADPLRRAAQRADEVFRKAGFSVAPYDDDDDEN